MSAMTKKQYHEQAAQCDGLCVVDHTRIAQDDPTKMPCVTCPFCQEIVTAELTSTTIHCPSCHITVKR